MGALSSCGGIHEGIARGPPVSCGSERRVRLVRQTSKYSISMRAHTIRYSPRWWLSSSTDQVNVNIANICEVGGKH